jgi:hypothetical protein
MTKSKSAPSLEAVIKAARKLYSHDECQIFVSRDSLNPIRHEDKTLNHAGTWIDVAVFVPDKDVE